MKEKQIELIKQAEIIRNQIKTKGCASEDDLNALKAIELNVEQDMATYTAANAVNNLFFKVKKLFKTMFKL